MVERAGFLSFENYPLVTNLGETCCCCTTCHSWLVGDTGFYGVVVFGEGTSNKWNHFLNKISRISVFDIGWIL
jgi:hypothetical protein